MDRIEESKIIKGVFTVKLRPFGDERGRFMETFRKDWFPQRNWDILQMNRSDSQAGVLRGLHFHHHQVDYWCVAKGMIRAGMVDLRPSSPTYLHTQTIEIGDFNEMGLFIPIGVAHGFLALSDVTLTYIVDNYYDNGRDENGVAWNDPDIGIDWGISQPILSKRDAENAFLRDIPPEARPK